MHAALALASQPRWVQLTRDPSGSGFEQPQRRPWYSAANSAPLAEVGAERVDDEADWIRRAQAGDREAFSRLVDAHREVAYRTAYWILRDADDALDVTQEAFLRAYRSLNRFAGRSSFRTWLRRIATNAALDRRQRRLREPELPETLQVADDSPGAAERLAREETRALVRQAIDELPPASRAAVVLRDVHGLSYAEIAETLRIPKGTVMSRIHKGRQILRRKLADVLGPRAEVLQRARQEEVGP